MQKSFGRLWDGFDTNADAKKARDTEYKRFKKLGIKCSRWVLKNQLKQYDGLGQPNGGVCDVYMLEIDNADLEKYYSSLP